jgi:hypothetical protein
MFFHVHTQNTLDRIIESRTDDQLWSNLILDEPTGANVLTFSSGYGDGSYELIARRSAGELTGFSIKFIEID